MSYVTVYVCISIVIFVFLVCYLGYMYDTNKRLKRLVNKETEIKVLAYKISKYLQETNQKEDDLHCWLLAENYINFFIKYDIPKKDYKRFIKEEVLSI